MECADTNNDGLLDYTEFTERFHQPAENIGTVHMHTTIIHASVYTNEVYIGGRLTGSVSYHYRVPSVCVDSPPLRTPTPGEETGPV